MPTLDDRLNDIRKLAAELRHVCQSEVVNLETILIADKVAADLEFAHRLFALADVAIDCAPSEGDKAKAVAMAEAMLIEWHAAGGLSWLDAPRADAALVHFNFSKH